ncbi:MAG TPA: serine/threonine-protein kinase [Gaiellaceae bacterium]
MRGELVGDRYRLEETLGTGGMSEVWSAQDVELGRRVAIKLLGSDADPARFSREARAVAALAHPNICQLYDYGDHDGRPFMVLEYLGGGSLEDRLVPGESYPDEETRRIAYELAAALEHAHARGLVHRDLKPANVLFDEEGRAKIADFGIARLSGAGTLTEAGTLLGTAAYISPEQASGQPATPASDVYSFGVILYRMLSGRLPFEGESAVELASRHVNERPAPIAEHRRDAPPELAALAQAALAKAPQARPPDGGALVAALEGAEPSAGAETLLVPPADPTLVLPRRGRRPQRRPGWWQFGPAPLIAAAVLILAAGGVALAVLTSRSKSPGPATTRGAVRPRRPTTMTPAGTTEAATTQATRSTRTASTGRTTTRAGTTAPPAPPPPSPPPPPPTTVPTTLPTTVPSITLPTTT